MTTLFMENSYSLVTLLATAIICFGIGYLLKLAIIRKQRNRILKLEDEMLSNHARILDLEGKLAETTKDKNGVHRDFDMTSIKTDREVRIS